MNHKVREIVSEVARDFGNEKNTFDRTIQRAKEKSLYFGDSSEFELRDAQTKANDVTQACGVFYNKTLALIQVLDSRCRPELEKNPDYEATKKVSGLITKMNDSLNISSNVSVNYYGLLTTTLSSAYTQTTETILIAKYWKDKCANASGSYAEGDKKTDNSYNSLLEKWREESTKIKQEMVRQKEEAKKIVSQNIDLEIAKVNENTIKEIKEINTQIAEIQQKKEENEQRLNSLGIFRAFEKIKLKNQNEEIDLQLSVLKAKKVTVKQNGEAEETKLNDSREIRLKEAMEKVEKNTHIPPEPEDPEITRKKERIYGCMVEGLKYTVDEILLNISFWDVDRPQQLSPLLHSLVAEGKLHSTCIKGTNYFYKGEIEDDWY